MFYVASFITFRLFSDFLWKSNLLICYKLNIFRPPQVKQFDMRSLLFGGFARFIPLDKMVETFPLEVNLCQSYIWHFLPCVIESRCGLTNYYWNNYNIVLGYVCFYHCLSCWKYTIFLTPTYWRKYLTDLSCDIS